MSERKIMNATDILGVEVKTNKPLSNGSESVKQTSNSLIGWRNQREVKRKKEKENLDQVQQELKLLFSEKDLTDRFGFSINGDDVDFNTNSFYKKNELGEIIFKSGEELNKIFVNEGFVGDGKVSKGIIIGEKTFKKGQAPDDLYYLLTITVDGKFRESINVYNQSIKERINKDNNKQNQLGDTIVIYEKEKGKTYENLLSIFTERPGINEINKGEVTLEQAIRFANNIGDKLNDFIFSYSNQKTHVDDVKLVLLKNFLVTNFGGYSSASKNTRELILSAISFQKMSESAKRSMLEGEQFKHLTVDITNQYKISSSEIEVKTAPGLGARVRGELRQRASGLLTSIRSGVSNGIDLLKGSASKSKDHARKIAKVNATLVTQAAAAKVLNLNEINISSKETGRQTKFEKKIEKIFDKILQPILDKLLVAKVIGGIGVVVDTEKIKKELNEKISNDISRKEIIRLFIEKGSDLFVLENKLPVLNVDRYSQQLAIILNKTPGNVVDKIVDQEAVADWLVVNIQKHGVDQMDRYLSMSNKRVAAGVAASVARKAAKASVSGVKKTGQAIRDLKKEMEKRKAVPKRETTPIFGEPTPLIFSSTDIAKIEANFLGMEVSITNFNSTHISFPNITNIYDLRPIFPELRNAVETFVASVNPADNVLSLDPKIYYKIFFSHPSTGLRLFDFDRSQNKFVVSNDPKARMFVESLRIRFPDSPDEVLDYLLAIK